LKPAHTTVSMGKKERYVFICGGEREEEKQSREKKGKGGEGKKRLWALRQL